MRGKVVEKVNEVNQQLNHNKGESNRKNAAVMPFDKVSKQR